MARFAGIDIGKTRLDAWMLPEDGYHFFDNTAAGRAALGQWLGDVAPDCIVVEAGGAYERPVSQLLIDAGLPLARVNPRQVRDFAKAGGHLAKTDRIDAKVLASFAQTFHPEPSALPDAEGAALSALVTRRRQLVDMRTEETNRLEATLDEQMREDVAETVRWLKARIIDIDHRIAVAVKTKSTMADVHQLLCGIPGVGLVTAAVLIAELPELGHIDNAKIAALAGLAPMNHDSGAMRGQRHIRGGRTSLRCALYMATLSAIRHHPKVNPFYKRLRDNGKPPKVALIAAARKLLIYINAAMRDHYAKTQTNA
jgi:transposase